MGINLGTVGFLTDLSTNKIEGLNEILKGNYIEEDRPVFETFSDNLKKEIFLNEVVIHSGSVTKMLELELSIQDQVIYNIRADGLIISTSTGSTAYSYSGGGPIISPKLDALSLLPMFSHSSSSHSLLLSSKEEIQVKILSKNLSSIQVFVDGKKNLKYKKDGLKVFNTKKLLNFITQKIIITEACRTKLGWAVSIENLKRIKVRTILKFNWLLILLAINPLVNSQNNSDLEYLELFPENQSNDIASRIPSNNVLSEDDQSLKVQLRKKYVNL